MNEQEKEQEQIAEAREIILQQMKTLQEQTERMIKANSATPAQNIAALSHELTEAGRALLEYGRR